MLQYILKSPPERGALQTHEEDQLNNLLTPQTASNAESSPPIDDQIAKNHMKYPSQLCFLIGNASRASMERGYCDRCGRDCSIR